MMQHRIVVVQWENVYLQKSLLFFFTERIIQKIQRITEFTHVFDENLKWILMRSSQVYFVCKTFTFTVHESHATRTNTPTR